MQKTGGDAPVNMTYSGVLRDKNGKQVVRVRFERKKGRGTDFAEGVVPSCKITGFQGFTAEETKELSKYLKEHTEDIIAKAKSISSITHLFGG
ncbi:MAG: hypothetical protein J6P05_00555 [Lachnospiraceae bacterium]|nr:hypothetical protein [Lachnospiraceae bacterium]